MAGDLQSSHLTSSKFPVLSSVSEVLELLVLNFRGRASCGIFCARVQACGPVDCYFSLVSDSGLCLCSLSSFWVGGLDDLWRLSLTPGG